MSAPERIWVWGWYDVDRDSYPVFERDWDEDNPIKHAPWLTSAEMPPAKYIHEDAVAEMIRQAVKAEREACAKAAHDWQNETGTDIAAPARVCPQIAAAIRARGET